MTPSADDSAARLQEVMDNVPAGIASYDANQRLRLANRRYAAYFGSTPEAMIGKTIEDYVPARSLAEILPHWERCLRDGVPVSYRRRNTDPRSGDSVVLDVDLVPEVADGQVVGIFALLLDVTEKTANETRLAERNTALAARERELKLIVNSVPAGLVAFDRDARVRFSNDLYARFFGRSAAEILGRSIAEYISAEGYQLFWPSFQRCLSEGTPQGYQRRTYPPGIGEERFIDVRLVAEKEADVVVGVFALVLDVTERVRAERALVEINETLEQRVSERTRELAQNNLELREMLNRLTQAQDELVRSEKLAALGSLVAGVAHELNTPIGTCLTVASTLSEDISALRQELTSGSLRRSALDDYMNRAEQAARLLMRNTGRAAELVTDFKQIAVDQTSDRRRTFDLAEFVGELTLTLRAAWRGDAPRIETAVPAGLAFNSFPGALVQILQNLLINAKLHAFEPGRMGVVRISAEPLVNSAVEITVDDNGKGIPADILPRIFDPFFTTKLGQGGSGLGLHICHNLATQLLGGRLRVHSMPGRGTQFVLEIPLEAPDRDARADAETTAMETAPLDLVLEDEFTPQSSSQIYTREDLIEIRAVLERRAAHAAAQSAQPADKERIRRSLIRLEHLLDAGNDEAVVDADLRFHWAILQATRDPVLQRMGDMVLQLMHDNLRRDLPRLVPDAAWRSDLGSMHRAIWLAIEAGDAEAAARAADAHMDMLVSSLERLGTTLRS